MKNKSKVFIVTQDFQDMDDVISCTIFVASSKEKLNEYLENEGIVKSEYSDSHYVDKYDNDYTVESLCLDTKLND